MHILKLLHREKRIHTNKQALFLFPPCPPTPVKNLSLFHLVMASFIFTSPLQQWKQFFWWSLGWIEVPVITALTGITWTLETGLYLKLKNHETCSCTEARWQTYSKESIQSKCSIDFTANQIQMFSIFLADFVALSKADCSTFWRSSIERLSSTIKQDTEQTKQDKLGAPNGLTSKLEWKLHSSVGRNRKN